MTTATSLSFRILFTKIPSSYALHNVFAKPASSTVKLIENLNSSANFLHYNCKRSVATTALNLQNKLEVNKNNKKMSQQYQTIEKGAPNSTNYSIYFSKYINGLNKKRRNGIKCCWNDIDHHLLFDYSKKKKKIF